MFIHPQKRKLGRLPDADGVLRHILALASLALIQRLRGEEILIARCVDVEAVSLEVFGHEPGLVRLGIDRFRETRRISFAEGQRGNVIDIRDAAESPGKIQSIPHHFEAFAGRAVLANLVFVVDLEKIRREFSVLGGVGAELRPRGKPPEAVIL